MKSFYSISLSALLLSFVILTGCADQKVGTADQPVDDTSARKPAETGETVDNGTTAPHVSTFSDQIGTVNSASGTPIDNASDFSSNPAPAPGFTWTGDDGSSGSLAELKGNVVLVNFWGTWCGPCRKELPDIVKLREEYGEKGFEVIGAAVNEQPVEGLTVEENLKKFAQSNGIHYPLVVASDELQQLYGTIQYVPTTFVIDRNGKVVRVLTGMMGESDFRAAIEPYL